MVASPNMAAPYDDDLDDDLLEGQAPFALPGGIEPGSGPVLTPLPLLMSTTLFISNNGTASIVHNKTLPENIAWVEYDVDVGSITLICWSGAIIPFRKNISPQMGLKLRRLRKIFLARVPDGGLADIVCEVPLVVRHIYKKTKPKTENNSNTQKGS